MNILIVVDMQNDFIDGALGTPEAEAIVPAVCDRIRSFDGTVLVTMDTHPDSYLDTQEGKKLPVPHCIRGTPGWQLNPAVQEALNTTAYTVFEKPAFGSTAMMDALKELQQKEGVESVELVGLCTDICVISNALMAKAFLPEVPVSVDAACCAGVTPESHANALAAMKMCQIDILNG